MITSGSDTWVCLLQIDKQSPCAYQKLISYGLFCLALLPMAISLVLYLRAYFGECCGPVPASVVGRSSESGMRVYARPVVQSRECMLGQCYRRVSQASVAFLSALRIACCWAHQKSISYLPNTISGAECERLSYIYPHKTAGQNLLSHGKG